MLSYATHHVLLAAMEHALLAELTNEEGTLLVSSNDWEMILLMKGRLLKKGHLDSFMQDRMDADGRWRWYPDEASTLADELERDGLVACPGRVIVVFNSGAISGTRGGQMKDGLSTQERTARLVAFLRKGGFCWRFVMEDTLPLG